MSELSAPTSIAVNSDGDLLVCLCDTRLVKFDKDWKMHTLVNFSNNDISWSIFYCNRYEDNIYCMSMKSNNILCCDKDGDNIQMHKVQQVEFPGHYGVAVVGDEVMLTEANNASTIMIYDKQFKYVR